ncbi:hypothetical protein [Iamia sp.]|uniref:hypothetical protein n=1 Tax=Iamia sp. TaxID=2722710 RepID=UPI002BFE2F21|nr:hypothetical protein [Iamia sp.]HXH58598.1 hypothetical protein [Iamia sp.]
MSTEAPAPAISVLVGGVGELYQGDLDVGRRLVERLGDEELGSHVAVEDLHYGAVAVAQRLDEARPSTLVLVGAATRGRTPGTVERKVVRKERLELTAQELQGAIGDAVTGYVTIDLVIEVAHALGVLPPHIVIVEVEPVRTGPEDQLSPEMAGSVDDILGLVRTEIRRAPLVELGARLREMVAGDRLEPSPAVAELRSLLAALESLEACGRWGSAFAHRDRLRALIGSGHAAAGMDHLDWALWWALLAELDRLQALESEP